MPHPGLLVFLLPLVPVLALAVAAVGHNAYRHRRSRWLEKRLAAICRAAGDDDRDPAPFARPADWPRLLGAIGALAEDAEILERHLAPVTEAAGPLFRSWIAGGAEELTASAASTAGRRRRRIRGHLILLRRARVTAPMLFIADCLLEGGPGTAAAAALLIGHHAEAYAEAAIPLTVALRNGPPEAAAAMAWALLRVVSVHPELMPVLSSDPAPSVRRTQLRAAAAGLAAGQGPPQLLGQIECGTSDSDPGVRILAYGALRHLEPARRLELAEIGLGDPNPEVARAAARCLASAADREAIDVLIRALGSAGAVVQSEVLDVLTQLGAPDDVTGSELEGADGRERAWALEVRAAIGDLDATGILGFLQHPQTEVRQAAASSLRRLAARSPSPQAPHGWLPQLLASWQQEKEPQVLLTLAECLATSSREVASEVILTRLSEVSDSVRERLLEILARAELLHQIETLRPRPLATAGEAAGR